MLQILVAIGCLLLFVGLYAGLMQLSIDVSRIDTRSSATHRDTVYVGIHLGLLAAATIGGFVVGKWLNGLGLAYAALFAAVLASTMVLAQLSSHALACSGHNDILRHWVC